MSDAMRVESREGGGGAPPKRNWFKLLIAESMSLPQSWRAFSRRWWSMSGKRAARWWRREEGGGER